MSEYPAPTDRQAKFTAFWQAACICVAVEVAIILVLGAILDSYVGAAVVSALVLGPVSLWIGPIVYRRLLGTDRRV